MISNDSARTGAWGRSTAFAVVLVAVVAPMLTARASADPVPVAKVTISLIREVSIPAQDTGILTKVMVHEGQQVVKGEAIAELDSEHQRLALRAAELNYQIATLKAEDDLATRTAETQLKEAQSGLRARMIALQIAEELAQSDVSIQVAAAETTMRQLELERAEKARSSFKSSISETELDRLRTAVEKGQLETQQAELDRRVQQLKPDAEQAAIDQKTEEVQRFETLVEQERRNQKIAGVSADLYANELTVARLKLDQRRLHVPFNGTIASVDVHEGEWVEPGMPVARIIDLQTLKAEGVIPSHLASDDLVGRNVVINVPGSEPIEGQITFVSSEVDPVLQQVRVRAEFRNKDRIFRPGMIGSMTIDN